MTVDDCREILKEGWADTQFDQRKFDAIGRLLLEVDILNAKIESVGKICGEDDLLFTAKTAPEAHLQEAIRNIALAISDT